MKAILVIDVDNIDIENTQATYIELQHNNTTIQMALLNHWLKPMPQKKNLGEEIFSNNNFTIEYASRSGYNNCIDEILGEEDEII